MRREFLLLFVLILFSGSAWAGLSDGLVLHCEFDGDTQDSSGNNLHGTIISGVNYTAGVDGDSGTAVYFSSSTSRIAFGNQSQINNVGNLFTIAFWVKIDAGNGGVVFEHDVVGTYNNDWMGGVGTGPSITMGNASYTSLDSPTNITDGTWRHVAYTRDQAAGTAKIYIDGELDTPRTGQYNEMIASTDFNLGAYDRYSTGSNYGDGFIGALDDFRIYGRVLSESEIQALAVPEPATLMLLGLGGLLLRRRKA